MKKKICIVCTSGLGTSLMIRLNLQALLKEFGMEVEIVHTDASSVQIEAAPLVVGAIQVVESLQMNNNVEVIALEDVVNKDYLKECLVHSKVFQYWSQTG